MGAVKGMVMDMEEIFYDYIAEEQVTNSDCFEEFLDKCMSNVGLKAEMSDYDIRYFATGVWNDFWSDYL